MFESVRTHLYSLLRVPPNPQPPLGAPGSARVFRAARNYYRLRLLGWGVTQLLTLFGIVVSLAVLTEVKQASDDMKAERRAAELAASNADPADTVTPPNPENHDRHSRVKWGREAVREIVRAPHNPFGRLVERSPWWLFPAIGILEVGGILLYLFQIPVTYALVRLEFESHWYIVTDRSLRIRSGLVSMKESTMSFANLQQVTVSQDPLQRLLRIADVRVQSAGGGSTSDSHGHTRDSMHTGIFHGVDNAPEIRDLILERLRLFRAAGLGDPDDHHDHHEVDVAARDHSHSPANAAVQTTTSDTLAAAHEILADARALRATLEARR